MKKKCIVLISLITFVSFAFIYAQDNALVSGNMDFLKQEKSFNVEFSYESMAVGQFRTESEYIHKKVTEYNNSEPGKGDKWLVKWNKKKVQDFEPIFLRHLNKKIIKAEMIADTNLTNSKFTIIIKPYYLEEGWDVVVSSEPAIVRLQILVCETNDKSKQVAEFRVTGEYYKGSAIFGGALAFEEAGKEFGKFLLKSLRK